MVAAAEMTRLFKRQFLSFRLGLMKPDPKIYRHVARGMNVPPARILFFDDTQVHVDGARAVGIDAHRVGGPDEAREILDAYGSLRGGRTSSGST
jgi:putative hydrolase of the HAD superfamily